MYPQQPFQMRSFNRRAFELGMRVTKKPAAELQENTEGLGNFLQISFLPISIIILCTYSKLNRNRCICAINLSEFTHVLNRHPCPTPKEKKKQRRGKNCNLSGM